jgi:glycosyltransferase involved in cell wall biosynthesis
VSDPIRILRVIARLNVGGPALHVSYLTSELDRLGYETTLVAGRVGPTEGSMEYVPAALGVQPLYLPELGREIAVGADAAAVRSLLALIHRIRPHVLHTHTAKAGAVGRTAALLAGRARPQAVVHTFHGHVLRGYFGPVRTEAFRRLEQSLARSTDALIAVSPEVRDDLVALGIAQPEKIAVIRLGLDLSGRLEAPPEARRLFRLDFELPPEAFVVGWLGRMTEIKRVDQLLEAFAVLARKRDDAYLLLVGDGPLRGALESQALRLEIMPRCRFVGFREDVAAVFAACDVIALTSANEGTPVSLIEASASGLPVVSTEAGGVGDVVRDGETGFVLPTAAAAPFAERLERLASDHELARRLGEQGSEFVNARYSIPRLVSDVDSLYRELLVRRAAPTGRRRSRAASNALPRTLTKPVMAAGPERRLRVLLLSQYFSPEVGATQTRIQAFAEYLSDRGHDVTVICEFPNHPQGVIPERYRGRLYEDDRANPYRVLRVWVNANEEKTQATRLTFYLSFMTLATAVAPLAGPVDVVVATSPPLFTGLAGLLIARMKRAPFVLDVRDLWPAAATSLGQISPGLVTRAGLWLERFLYRAAAQVVAVTQPFCEHIDALRRPGQPGTHLIPNGTLDLFFEKPERLERFGVPEERFLITFAGMHGIAQALPSVLDTAERMNGDAHFAFVGEGPVKEFIVDEAAKRNLKNVSFHPQVPLDEIVPALAGADALLVPLSSHPTFDSFVPSKLVDFMAVGRPILLSAAGEAVRILTKSGGGVAVAPEQPDELASAIQWLADHPAEAAEMSRRGRAFADCRRRSVYSEELEKLLFEVTNP